MNKITIQPITSKAEIKQFIKFPWKIYRTYPEWVPPLLMDRRKLIDKKKNPFYKHAEAEFFLARLNGEIVGRIGAIINYNHNKEHNENIGFFGFFESINDQSVANALFQAARQWLKRKGNVTAMRGPVSPSVNDEYGLLVEGFDKPPVVLMPYNPPYYSTLIERAGFHKIKDLYAYHVKKDKVFSDKLVRVAEKIKQREGLTFRSLNMDDFENEVKRIKELYSRAWQNNWGAVPLTDDEIEAFAKDLKPVVVPELVIFAEYRGKPIGFSLSLPDINIALKHNKRGWLIPGIFCLMWYRKKINWIRIILLGVVPEHLKTGAAAVLFYETGKRGIEQGYHDGEAGWVLEDNLMMIRAAEFLNSEQYKTYRLYQQPI